jgi:hypothetical protein
MELHERDRRTTSREQVSRIDRGYYLRASPMRSWRAWLGIACFTAAVGWCAWGAFDQPGHYSPGAVIAPHARVEGDCQSCHVPFTPIKNDTWLSTGQTRAEMDAKCEACHRGPAHHPLQIASDAGSCASCHADHRGRGADITRVADRTCTVCHADIADHRLAGQPGTARPSEVAAPITRFDTEHHPEFESLKTDPGTLKFSHGRHMTAGLVFGGPSKNRPMSYAILADADRDRMMPPAAAAGDLVQLDCASCHEFATSVPPGDIRQTTAGVMASKPGAYPLPVSFERHCVACHALPLEPDGSGTVLPHGLDAEGMRRFILTTLLEQSPSGQSLLDAPQPPPALPANSPPETPPVETIRTILKSKLTASRAFTRGLCGKCHDVADAQLPMAALFGEAREGSGGTPMETWFRVPPVTVPDIWFGKARFDHEPHRGFDCRLCHEAAYPKATSATISMTTNAPGAGDLSPLDHGRVMIAGRESCTACHAPAGIDAAGKSIGGARFDCVECHGYHGLGPHDGLPAAAAIRSEAAELRRVLRLE